MNQQGNPTYPLSIPNPNHNIENAFEGDLLARKALAERLTGYLDRLKAGAVLAIDAQWGDGKTWFGRHWAKHLEDNAHKVIYIDAFEQDYVEDPFMLIAAELAEVLDEGEESTLGLREKATGVMKAILPASTKALINIAGRMALGSIDLSSDIEKAAEAANKSAADVASKWVEKKFLEHTQEKASLQHFRSELKTIAEKQEKPIVIFIDELDRCRPTFAVRLIERIKHFFDVPNVVFVLLINRDQLEKAIEGVYGIETDSTAYLGKFVNFFFKLPREQITDSYYTGYTKKYIHEVLSRYKFDLTVVQHSNFRDCFTYLAHYFDLSLRDIEKGVALYAFAQPINEDLYDLLAYEIALKIANQDLFSKLLLGSITAHEEAKNYINQFNEPDWMIGFISDMHTAHINNFSEIGENFERFNRSIARLGIRPEKIFGRIAERIDLSI